MQAWDNVQARKALNQFGVLAASLLKEAGGYLVELTSSGLCLAAFENPLNAIVWGLVLIEQV